MEEKEHRSDNTAQETDDGDLLAQVKQFKEQNPRLAEALEVFAIADYEYQRGLQAMAGAQTVSLGSANAIYAR